MAFSMNRVTLIGNVGGDPELRTIPSGAKVCTISVATSERYQDKASGEWKDLTEWHRVVLWDYLADNAYKYLKKGSKVCIEGKNKTSTYEKDGVTHYKTEIQAREIIFLDRVSSGGERSEGSSSYSKPSPPSAAQDFEETFSASNTAVEDDIPF